jgi:chloramphenicol 3-O-phosphotransferase
MESCRSRSLGNAVTTPGTILVLNGTSGSGKSTACELFARTAPGFWLLYGVDHFISSTFPSRYGHHGPFAAEGFAAVPRKSTDPDGPLEWRFGELGMRAIGAFHEWAASAAREGCNIILDQLLMTDPPLLQDLAWRLQGLPSFLITLKPPYAVLERRVAERAMTKKMPDELGSDAAQRIVDRLNRLRPWFYEAIYENEIADLTIDTSIHAPDAVCAQIAERVALGSGTAFARIRERWPRPNRAATTPGALHP